MFGFNALDKSPEARLGHAGGEETAEVTMNIRPDRREDIIHAWMQSPVELWRLQELALHT